MRALFAMVLLLGCGDDGAVSPDAPPPDAEPPRPFGIADMLAPTTDEERAHVEAEWAARDITARDVEVLATGSITLGTVPATYRVLEHSVDGDRHVGVVVVPDGLTAPAPVLVYAHGGFTGEAGLPPFDIASLQTRIPGQPMRSKLVYVVPAYRGERVAAGGTTYTAEGFTMIGNTDLTDTAALLTAVLESTPMADPDRVAIFGESRGGMVALSLGARDKRFALVVDAFGPTDFRLSLAGVDAATFNASVAAAVMDPTNPAHLVVRSLVPLEAVTVEADGSLTITADGYREARRRITATSAIATPLALPATQVHHGTADTTSSVESSRELAKAMAAAGRASPSDLFTYYEYPGGTHDLASLTGAVGRIAEAITRVLAP